MTSPQQQPAFPPGPRPGWFGFPILRDYRKDPLAQLDRLHREHGDTVSYCIGPYRQYLFFHPDQIRQLLSGKAKAFRRFTHPINVMRQWNGDSLIVAEGEQWIRKRRLVQPAFQPQRLAGYFPAIWSETCKLRERWHSLLASNKGVSATLDIQPEMNGLTLNVIGQTMFASDLGAEAAEIGKAVASLSQIAVDEFQWPILLPRWIPTPHNLRKNAAIRVIDRIVRRMISEHEQATTPGNDLLSALLTHTETDPDGSKHQLNREEIRNEVTTLLLAGHDTTAAGLIWTLYHVAANPEVQQQARDEVDRVLGQSNPTFQDIGQLVLLDRIVKESLRLHPPGIGVFIRQALEDVQIGDWWLRKGDLAGTYSWVVHHDARWFPDPERFDPDRFLPERFALLPQGAYFPFGAGPRMCVGLSMASLEILVVVAALLKQFVFRLPTGASKPRALALLSLRPEGGMPIELAGR